jgi:hypothetical protein
MYHSKIWSSLVLGSPLYFGPFILGIFKEFLGREPLFIKHVDLGFQIKNSLKIDY